jgi:hypothetical protein
MASFGEVIVGEQGMTPTELTIRNGTRHDVSVATSLAGTDPGDFQLDTLHGGCALDQALPPQVSCRLAIVFAPTAPGQRSASVVVHAGSSTMTAALSGTGRAAGSVTLSPTMADFGEVPVGDQGSAPGGFMVTNETNRAVVVTTSLTGTHASDFQLDTLHGGCAMGQQLQPRESCVLDVLFVPTATGARNATLTVQGGASTATAALSGTGTPAGSVTLSPTMADFGEVPVGDQGSPPGTFRVTNETSHPVVMMTSLTGAHASDFQLRTLPGGCDTGQELQPSGSCVLDVLFAPTATGARNATLTVQAGSSTITSALSGTGTPGGSVTLSPTMVSFGTFPVGSESGAMSFLVSNETSKTVSLSAFVAGTQAMDFVISGHPQDCGGLLAPGFSCTLGVRFAPTATGARSAILTVQANATTVTALLSGTGAPAGSVTIIPELMSFGNVTVGSPSPAMTFTLHNGTPNPFLLSTALMGAQRTDFQINAGTCPGMLAPDASCDISVRFTPSATGSRSATLLAGTPGPFAALVGVGWASQDIGAVAAAGGSSQSGNAFKVRGSGADIFGTADEFRYVYQDVTGDATITARVASIGKTDKWAKAALMMRGGTAANAPYAAAVATPTPANHYRLQARTKKGGTTTSASGGSGRVPGWLRVVRTGGKLTAYVSVDGAAWTKLGAAISITMPPTIAVGLAVTSHHDGSLATGLFEEVKISQP